MLIKAGLGANQSKGYGVLASPDGIQEEDTITCHHCQRIIRIPHGSTPDGGWCSCCSKVICGPCVDKGTCTPFEKRLEEIEARQRFLNSVGL